MKARSPDGDILEHQDLSQTVSNISRLHAARVNLSQKYNLGGIRDGGNVTGAQVQAKKIVLAALDNELGIRTQGGSGKAAEQYAKYMQLTESFEEGQRFFNQRLSDDPVQGMAFKEYRERLKKRDPDALIEFDNGVKAALVTSMDMNGIRQALRNFVGKGAAGKTTEDLLTSKHANIEMLKEVVGPKKAEEFLEAAKGEVERGRQADLLREILELKIKNPKAIDDIMREGDDLLLASSAAPGNTHMVSVAGGNALVRWFKSRGPKQAAVQQKAISLTGEEGVDFMKEVISDYRKRSAYRVGGLTLGSAGAPEHEDVREDLDQQAIEEGDAPDPNEVKDVMDSLGMTTDI